MTLSRYNFAVYDDPQYVYEQAWVVTTEANDSVTSVGYLEKLAVVSYIEQGDTVDATANVTNAGNTQYTEADDTLNSLAYLERLAVVTYTEDDDTTTSSSRLLVQGIVTHTEDDDNTVTIGILPIVAVLVTIDSNDTVVSYIHKAPWGGSTSYPKIPYEVNSGININPPYTVSSGYYGNRRPYEES